MSKSDFHVQRLDQDQPEHRSSGLIFAAILAVLLLIASFFFAPKLAARWQRWQEEQRIAEIRAIMAELPEESFRETQNAKPLPIETVSEPEPDFLERIAELDPTDLPAEKLLAVPFICQNPFQDELGWEVHRESCEEASLLQAMLYLSGETVSKEEADRLIRDMIAWQKRPENFGKHKDLYGEDMREFILGYYELEADEVIHVKDLSADKIRRVLALGYPLIVPIQGSLLQNPYYPEPGYHMMTVIGYNASGVITNDVGTKRGEKFPYTWDKFLNANEPVGNDALVVLSQKSSGQ